MQGVNWIFSTAAMGLLAMVGSARANFPAPAGSNCPDATEAEFRYVKLVTKAEDPAMSEPLKMALDLRSDGLTDIYFVERHGNLKKFDAGTKKVSIMATLKVFSSGENGLTGIVLDPHFKQNHWMYLFYAPATPSIFRLSRFTVAGDKLDTTTEKVLLSFDEARTVPHTGGAMQFDSTGDLWLTVGNNSSDYPSVVSETSINGSAESSSGNAGSLRGGVLRIHPDNSAKGYSIPAGNFGEYFANYFTGKGNTALAADYRSKVLPEIYVKGTRNAYTMSVDPVRRWMVWGDFGPNIPTPSEEHDLVTHPIFGGYPYFAGANFDLVAYTPAIQGAIGKKDPLAPMNNSKWNTGPKQLPPATPALHPYMRAGAITGPIYRYDGALNSSVKFPPHFDKAWFLTDWHWGGANSGGSNAGIRIYKVSDDGSQLTDSLHWFASYGVTNPIDFKQGPDGSLYIISYAGFFTTTAATHIGRIEYTGTCHPAQPTLSTALRETRAKAADLQLGRSSIHVGEAGAYTLRLSDIAGRELRVIEGKGPADYALGALLDRKGLYFVTLELPSGRYAYKLPYF